VVALFLPTFDGPHMRQRGNEASTVGTLIRLTKLQSAHARAFPLRGFACDFAALHPIGAVAKEDNSDFYWDQYWYLNDAPVHRSGYVLNLTNCPADTSGRVSHYAFVAVPQRPGTTGFRAFCADDTGAIYYDDSGSAEACLVNKKPLN
jgi:hypothetical protein